MRRLLPLIVAALGYTAAYAQPYGNEWINYEARYWSMDLWQEGLYKLDSATLAAAGFPLDEIDSRTIQLFGREKQIPIYVTGDSDGVLNSSDMIEFFFERNDAWMDADLYKTPEDFKNPYVSLISDTVQYFLTWNASPDVKRVKAQSPFGYVINQDVREWFWTESRWQPNASGFYRKGLGDVIGFTSSKINDGEGMFNLAWVQSGSLGNQDFPLSARNKYNPGPNAKLEAVVAGVNASGGQQFADHHLQVFAGDLSVPKVDTAWVAERTLRLRFEAPTSSLAGNDDNVIRFKLLNDLPGPPPGYTDRQALAVARLLFPHSTNFGGQTGSMHMWFPNDANNSPAHVKLAYYYNNPLFYVWGDTLRRIIPHLELDGHNALVPADASDTVTHVYLVPENTYNPVPPIRQVGADGHFTDYTANVVDSAMVIITHPKLMNGALQYANYRENISWNHYNTLVADVTELYQQYGGGVKLHPLAIRRFMKDVLNTFNTKPRALFLIGKATTAAHFSGSEDSRGYRRDLTAWKACLVPSMGYPPSDALFTLGLGNNPNEMTVPVGRLAAQTNQQVLDYLTKVDSLEHVQLTPAAWMKNVLHFRGGFEPGEQIAFENYLADYASIVDTLYFQGHVTKFGKPSGVVISQATADSVYNLINEGVSIMTFFAHANGGGFDITIDQPNNYQWHSRYPLMIGNSCYTGNIHQISSGSASEQFVLPANAGAIAFMASIDLGVTGALYLSTRAFYESLCKWNYGKSLGTHLQYMDSSILDAMGDQDLYVAGIQQFTLHGDPTLILNSPELPDFEVKAPDIRLNPDPVSADVDSFQVTVKIRNIGKGTTEPFYVNVERWVDQGGQQVSLDTASQLHVMQSWQDEVVFTLPVLADSGGIGLNHIQVRIDRDPDQILEFEEEVNNVADINFQITSGDLLPVDPFNFAITPDPAPELKASTGDPFAPVRTYIFQIDTTDLYNSPMMEQATVTAPGGVVSWQPLSIFSLNNAHDSIVYYWRCSIDSTGNGEYDWHEFSFQHITGRRGWGQAHYFQFKKNDYGTNLLYNRPQRDFEYFTGQKQIGCLVRGNSVAICKWSMDLVTQEGGVCGTNPAFHMAVVDPFDFQPWTSYWNGTGHFLNADDDMGGGSCVISYRPQRVFIFKQDNPAKLVALANAFDSIPVGHYVLLYTYRSLFRDLVDVSPLNAALTALGATNYASGAVPDSVPYIFFCRKGMPGYTQEVWGDTINSLIDFVKFLDVTGNTGSMVGPQSAEALTWNSLHWEMKPNVPTDSARLVIKTVNADGVEAEAYNMAPTANIDSLRFDTIGITPLNAERLRLTGSFWSELNANTRPAQTKRWQIVASPAPECAIDPPSGYFVHADSLFEGQEARVMVAVRNISDVYMDSLLIEARIVGADNVSHRVHYRYNAPLQVGGIVFDTITFNLAGYAGDNSLVIEANPIDTTTGHYDQREQYHFNNIAVLRFKTLRDQENPLLDVTFDGVHILNGDIVSAEPEIDMRLDDENRSLLMNSVEDTVLFKVFLYRPGANDYVRIYFRDHLGNEQLKFVPATGPDNVCHILYHPNFVTDGKYTLRVQASDISRNASGDRDYSIEFEVVNKPTITEVLNYPNPFTTSTRFVFTLTGRETPTGLRIRIMNISGRVVREIGLDEIGPMHVGRNITEYAWDGTDQFGDKLARGVYLYQVVAQLHGEDIEYRETSAGGYFTKGFGKMYLLR